MDNQEPKAKSLAKALKVLSCFTSQEPVLGVTELAERIGVTKSNIHNILSTFTWTGGPTGGTPWALNFWSMPSSLTKTWATPTPSMTSCRTPPP